MGLFAVHFQSHSCPLTTALLLVALQGQHQTGLRGMVRDTAQDLPYSLGTPSCPFPVLPPAGCHQQHRICPAWPQRLLFGVSG